MGKLSTKEILDRYYASEDGLSDIKERTKLDKPELYAYEEKIGKELIDMDVDDLIGLILELKNKRKGVEVKFLTSHSGLDQVETQLRKIFNFYIDNIEIIRNPLNDKRMKGKEMTKRLAEGREAFRWEIVEEIIQKLHQSFDRDNADYRELILLLFYNGFAKAEEIVKVTADKIDHESKTVHAFNKKIHLSDRCYELLTYFYEKEEIAGWRGNFALASWNGSYFKFIVRPSRKESFCARPLSAVCDVINRYIANDINDLYQTKINYHILYMLGFYNYMERECGSEQVKQMILSYRDSADAARLMELAREYGVRVENVSHLKRYLRPFFEADT